MFVFPYHLFGCEEKYLNLSFDSGSPMAGIVVCVARLCVHHCIVPYTMAEQWKLHTSRLQNTLIIITTVVKVRSTTQHGTMCTLLHNRQHIVYTTQVYRTQTAISRIRISVQSPSKCFST